MITRAISMLVLIAVAACGQEAVRPARSDSNSAGDEVPKIPPPAPAQPESNSSTPVAERRVDPNSAQAAGQVVQRYAALLEGRRLPEARKLWSDGGRASELTDEGFAEAYGKYAQIRADIGPPGRIEGAAGSAYVDIPVRFTGTLKSGQPVNSAGIATLRRVNDVPGSTEDQRRWHIYRLDLQPPL